MTRRINRRDAIAAMLAAAGAVSAPNVLRAQAAFPNRPIRIVVPVAPGGGVDTFARLIAAKVKTQRDVQFIVENRTGGNSTIGGLDVQRAAPDGYTVLFHASTHNVARLVLKNAPYDPVADFTPIALAGNAPLVHIVSNNRPEKTLAEIVAAAKASPDKWSFATAQLGAPGHLAAVAFNQYNGLNLPIIPYRGTAPAANDVVGGHVPMMIEAILSLLPMVRAGSVRAIAVTSTKRSIARAGDSDHGGGRPAGAQLRRLVGDVGAARPAGRSDQHHQRLGQRRGEGPGRRGPSRRARHRAVGGDARRPSRSSSPRIIDRSAKLLKAANFQPE